MATEPFKDFADSPTAPSLECFAITPSDTGELPKVTKALYVGEGGDVVLRAARGQEDVVFRNLPSGYTLDVRVRAVLATGTTASALVGLA
ncbi:hypothetical protein [Erythrobacter sp. HL-111]|uniref:spike base protein, RCAP_Rcc01079 family n=1 Tax=Erythrobacter sp. HL-111 TaxID=1798193 RepID=UPI0006DA1F6B|nr:hypothetical protein [Erythrobacter sp. HL-111]KPP94400.1 MAG: hypothetical protein HLUCCO15_04445 [Erythrobacteraceae bacterium HL-111]SDS54697.1 hypothetical protein SAMN04515621_1767 [Erythrobacter sp. HL-111]